MTDRRNKARETDKGGSSSSSKPRDSGKKHGEKMEKAKEYNQAMKDKKTYEDFFNKHGEYIFQAALRERYPGSDSDRERETFGSETFEEQYPHLVDEAKKAVDAYDRYGDYINRTEGR